MHRDGHIGVALAAYAPLGAATTIAVTPEVAFLGVGLAVPLAMLPDVDTKLPLVTHRGYSHTIWFAMLVGMGCGVVAATVGSGVLPLSTGERVAFATAVGTTTICSHVAADAITPMGVRPFAPLGRRYSLGLVQASNRIANLLLLVLGVGVLVGAFALAARFG